MLEKQVVVVCFVFIFLAIKRPICVISFSQTALDSSDTQLLPSYGD
jgi:hypothetical protein